MNAFARPRILTTLPLLLGTSLCALWFFGGCEEEANTPAPLTGGADGSTGSGDPSLDAGAADGKPADAAGSGGTSGTACLPGSGGVMVFTGAGTADVSFEDRIDPSADTSNFFVTGVAAKLFAKAGSPPHALEIDIGAPTKDGGTRWLHIRVADKGLEGLRTSIIYPVIPEADAAGAQQSATIRYAETTCSSVWEGNGKRGSLVISRLEGTSIDAFLGNGTVSPSTGAGSQKGTFTLRALLAGLVATQVTE